MSHFTYDWFTPQVPLLEQYVPRTAKSVLEVGCFEGRSTLWFLEHAPEAVVTVVDHFRGGADHGDLDLNGLYQRFKENMSQHLPRVRMLIGNTWEVWPCVENEEYEVVYVDASHRAGDVLFDATNAIRVCKTGGLIVFDDYEWGQPGEDRPHEAVDAFLHCYAKSIEIVYKDYQVFVRKVCLQY